MKTLLRVVVESLWKLCKDQLITKQKVKMEKKFQSIISGRLIILESQLYIWVSLELDVGDVKKYFAVNVKQSHIMLEERAKNSKNLKKQPNADSVLLNLINPQFLCFLLSKLCVAHKLVLRLWITPVINFLIVCTHAVDLKMKKNAYLV